MALRKGIARRRALRIGHQMPGKSARSDPQMPDEIWGQCQIGPSDGNHRRPQMAINAREDTSPLTWYGSLRVLIEGFGPMGNGSRAVITLRGVPVRASSVATCMQLGGEGGPSECNRERVELCGSQRHAEVTQKVLEARAPRGTPRGAQRLLKEALERQSRALKCQKRPSRVLTSQGSVASARYFPSSSGN